MIFAWLLPLLREGWDGGFFSLLREAPTPALPQWWREKFSALLEMAQHGGVEGLRIVDVGQVA